MVDLITRVLVFPANYSAPAAVAGLCRCRCFAGSVVFRRLMILITDVLPAVSASVSASASVAVAVLFSCFFRLSGEMLVALVAGSWEVPVFAPWVDFRLWWGKHC